MKTPEQKRAAKWLTEEQKKTTAAIAAAKVPTEEEMRDGPDPHPKTIEELVGEVKKLVERPHDYGTCVYAMSLAAVAAFNYVASALGVTGFQASCADLDIVRRTRRIKHGFMIVKAEDLLYPQRDPRPQIEEFLVKQRVELAAAARKLLEEAPNAHPAVVAHWKRLARDAQ